MFDWLKGRATDEPTKLRDFFCAAVSAFAQEADESAYHAALLTGVAVHPIILTDFVRYLGWVAGVNDKPAVGIRLLQLVAMLLSRDYAHGDEDAILDALRTKNPEYWLAYCNADATVFQRRYEGLVVPDFEDVLSADAQLRSVFSAPEVVSALCDSRPEVYQKLVRLGIIDPELSSAGMESLGSVRAGIARGDIGAEFTLGQMYLAGQEVPQDFAEAARWFRKAAEQGHAEAQCVLGASHIKGQGVPLDHVEAVRWLRKAAEQGHAGAQFLLGASYHKGQGVPLDHAEAVRWLSKAAEQGYASAQFLLGASYRKGQGVPLDHAEAVRWFRKAAEQGSAEAEYLLGLCHDRGQGVPQDFAEATLLYRQAAERGYARAQFLLGVAYVLGKLVPRDLVEAHMWLDLAASHATGDDQVNYACQREFLARGMTSKQIAEAQRKAREWKPKFVQEEKAP